MCPTSSIRNSQFPFCFHLLFFNILLYFIDKRRCVAFIARIKIHNILFFACPLNMNLLRRFCTVHGHPLATDRHPLTGISHLIHQRLYRHGAVHQADAGVRGVAVHAGVSQGRRTTGVTGGAVPGKRGRSAGPPPHGGCPHRFAASGALFPRLSVVGF